MSGNKFDITYLTTDSMNEGVGSSQVLPLITSLAESGLKVNLMTFEKSFPHPDIEGALKTLGVNWDVHRFGDKGSVAGIGRLREMYQSIPESKVVHARSDIPAVAAAFANQGPILWDVRGLWSDQKSYTENKILKRKLYKATRVLEVYAAYNSQAISTLTHNIVPELKKRNGKIPELQIVVPTTVDLSRFKLSSKIQTPFTGLYSGTYNRYYDLGLAASFTKVFLTLSKGDIHWARPKESPQLSLNAGETKTFTATQQQMNQIIPNYAYGMAVCDTKAGPSLKGAVPTKIAEFLACGRPVVINEGLGDFDQLFAEYRAGVIISRNKANLTQKAEELLILLNDPETPIRCRALAEDVFDMKIGVKKYMQVYEKISL